jgi:type I restriction enzyme S subunit
MTDLPQGWREVALGEVVSFAPKVRELEGPESLLVSFVPMKSVPEVTGAMDLSETITIGEGSKRNLTYFRDGDVIFAKITPCMENGKITLAKSLHNGAAFGSTEFHVLRPTATLNAVFLSLFLSSEDFRSDAAQAMTGAVGQRRVPKKYLESFHFPLPPLAEQERIVEILEEQFSRLDSALASVKAVREKAKAFRRSLLHSAFSGELTGGTEGWQTVNIDSLLGNLPNGKKVGQGWSPQCESVPASEGEWGVLKTTAIQAGRFEPEHNKRLPATLEPREAIEIQVGDLLMTCAGPRVRCGVPCLVRKTPQKLMMSGKMYRFRPDTKQVVPEYLEAYLLAPTTQSAINLLKTGISESGLNLTHARFFTLEVPKPPLATQERIVSLLEEQFSRLDKALEVANQLEARIASERRSLLHSAFTGALTATWRQNND